jgi:hypothetical protein
MTLAVATAAVGLVLLVLILPAVLRPARRFARALAALRRELAPRAAALRSLANGRIRHRR